MSNKGKQLPQMSLHCPTCNAPARVRTSRGISPTTRELYMECGNQECRAVFQAIVEATKIIAPSLLPPEEQTAAAAALHRGLRARREAPPPVDPRQMTLVEIPAHPPDT